MEIDPTIAAAEPVVARSTGWQRWQQHVFILFVGAVVGVVLTFWDYSYRHECVWPYACIDYTGVATVVYWLILGTQGLVSTVLIALAWKAKRPFFAAHVASALVVTGAMVVAQQIGVRRIAEIRRHRRPLTALRLTMSSRGLRTEPAESATPHNGRTLH